MYVDQQPSERQQYGHLSHDHTRRVDHSGVAENSHSFEALEPARNEVQSLKTTTGDPSSVKTTAVLPSFPHFAGVAPIAGRLFTTQDIVDGRRVAVVARGSGASAWARVSRCSAR